MGESIWQCSHLARDPRVERTRKHELHDILVIAICAVICGAESRKVGVKSRRKKARLDRSYPLKVLQGN